jgi:hypothetical protein
VLTDDGYTLQDLEQSGCKLDSGRRQGLLKMTLNGFGVQLNDRALEVHTSPDNFGLRKHNLVQAMLAVNDSSIWPRPWWRASSTRMSWPGSTWPRFGIRPK